MKRASRHGAIARPRAACTSGLVDATPAWRVAMTPVVKCGPRRSVELELRRCGDGRHLLALEDRGMQALVVDEVTVLPGQDLGKAPALGVVRGGAAAKGKFSAGSPPQHPQRTWWSLAANPTPLRHRRFVSVSDSPSSHSRISGQIIPIEIFQK